MNSKIDSRGAEIGPAASGEVKTTLGLLPMIALSAALTGPGFAQAQAPAESDGTRLEEIRVQGNAQAGSFKTNRVSSKKSTAALLDTPQTVNVIPQAVIEQKGARTLTEVLQATPGISFNAGENGFATSTNNFQIRGFDASGNVFLDGSRDSGAGPRDIFNVESVEVVKGAAADNGRGGAGGYVNMVTKTPLLEDVIKGEAGLSFDGHGTDVRKRTTLDVNRKVGETTAIRINGMWDDGGIAGRDIAEASSWGLAPSIAFGLGTDFRAIFAYEHLERNDRPDWGVPGATIPGLWTYNPLTAGARRDAFYGLNTDFEDINSDALVARFEYDVNDQVSISNQTRWARVDHLARFTIPTSFTAPATVGTSTNFYDRLNTSVTNQTNLTAQFDTGAWSHTLSAGLEFSREESEAGRYGAAVPASGSTNLFNPNPARAGAAPFNLSQTADVKVDTVAAYVYDTIKFNEQWQLTGGLRAERYNARISSKTAAGASNGAVDGFDTSETTLGGRIGLVYKPVESASIYGSYGVSALPPGSYLSNPDISRTGDDNAFPGYVAGAGPIRSHNYEVGVKWDLLGGDLSTTAALFRTEKKNIAYAGAAGDPAVVYGEQVVQGLELSAAGRLTEAWSIFGGVAFMDSERKHGPEVDRAARAANAGDYTANLPAGFPGATTTNGDELSFTPKVTANLWSTYDVTEKWTVGGGVQYVGSSWLGRPDDARRLIPNGKYGKLPDYFLVNAMASYKLTEDVSVRFNIDNLFDQDYAVSSNWAGSRATLGAPRTFRISTSFKF